MSEFKITVKFTQLVKIIDLENKHLDIYSVDMIGSLLSFILLVLVDIESHL